MNTVVPAILPMSRVDLEEKLAIAAKLSGVSRVQIDVVDGRFASPPSWPYTAPTELGNMVASGRMLPHLGHLSYEIDLMCLNADSAADAWIALGASRLTFHAESVPNLSRLLKDVRERHGLDDCAGLITLGLAVNVASDPALLAPHMDHISYVQFMGIAKIGRQGQPFERRVLERIKTFHDRYPNMPIQVDGGVSLATAKELVGCGVSTLIAGSAVFAAPDPQAAVDALIQAHVA